MLGDPGFWAAAMVVMGAGFLAPLPWNYSRFHGEGSVGDGMYE